MGEDLPAIRLAVLRHFLGVDRDHDALIAEFLRRFLDEFGPVHGRGIDRHLVGAGFQQGADVVGRAHAAADRHRHEAGLRRAAHHVENGAAIFVARGDVEKSELVRAGRVIGDGGFDRIAGVAQIEEFDALDDAAVFHVETGDDADFEHGSSSAATDDAVDVAAAPIMRTASWTRIAPASAQKASQSQNRLCKPRN